MLLATIVSSILTFAATPQELANPGPNQELLVVRFTNGTVARVRVVGLEGERVKLREVVLDGSMEVRHKLDEFEPSSSFRIELAARNPQTFEGRFAMAKRAAELDLPSETGQQVAAAMQSLETREDAESASMALRTWSSNALEGWLVDSLEAEDLTQSMYFLKLLSTRYADLRTEEQLDQLAMAVESLERDRAAKMRAKRQERLDRKTRDAIERRLKPIRADIEEGDKLYRNAISNSGSMTKSARLASEAIEAYTSAWQASLKLQKLHSDEESLVVEIESIANHLHDHAILSALHAANLLAVRGDFIGATEWVQWVLALDPTHEEGLEMKKTITMAGAASSAGWGVGWGRPLIRGAGGLR